MKSENKKQMPQDRRGSDHFKGQKGGKIQGHTEPKGMGGTGGHPVDKERPRDTLDHDHKSYNKGQVNPDFQSTDTSSKAGFRRNDDKDEDIRGASTSGIPGQGL